MASDHAPRVGPSNFYSQAKNDPEVLERRRLRKAALDAAGAELLRRAPSRRPDWDEERIMQMDRLALEHGKRCVMWDDAGAGLFLLLNWDWAANAPAAPAPGEHAAAPGWWANARRLLRPPLGPPPGVDSAGLAAWADAHTMAVHAALTARLGAVRRVAGGRPRQCALDDPYWARLQALPRPPREGGEEEEQPRG